MKKLIFTLLALALVQFGFSQTTYYWVGGTSGSWTDANSWSSTVGGSGGARSTPSASDVLIFDGSNIGGGSGTIAIQPNAETIGTLKVLNGADLAMQRTSSGTTYLVVAGMGAQTDLVVDATSKIRMTGDLGAMVLVLGPAAGGQISGQMFITGTGSNRIAVQAMNSLTFLNSSTCTVGSGTSPFSTTTTTTNPSVDKGVIFASGSTFIYKSGSNPFGGSSANLIQFQTGSTFVFEGTIASGVLSNARILSNLIVRNNTSVTADGNPYNIDNITIESGSTLLLRTTGTFPVSGNIVNNGTFGAAPSVTSSNLVMYGSTPQTISGTGTFNAFGAISVATGSELTIQNNLVLNGSTSSTVTGKINLGTYTLTGTNNWNGKPASTTPFTATTTAGSQTLSALSVFSGIGIGSPVSGPGIPAGAIIISTSLGSAPGGSVVISKAATASGTLVALSGYNNSPTIETANVGGVDGSIAVTGTKTFGDGSSYIFDAATSAPFPSALTSVNLANLTTNAAITLNKSIVVSGVITMNTGKITVPAGTTLELASTASISGSTSTKYMVTESNTGTGAMGVVKWDAFATTKTFPVGTAANYLPVTLTPVSSSDFTVNVFEGITNEGTPNGTAMSAAQKAEVVNAVWTINRTSSNTDNCDVTVNWTPALEGSTFTTLSNSQVGLSRNDGVSWGIAAGTGNNTTNTVTSTFSNFSPFGVGRKGVVLPLQFISFNAVVNNHDVVVNWNVQNELGMDRYFVERSADGKNFNSLSYLSSRNQLKSEYSFLDVNPISGVAYYRIKSVNVNGQISYTSIVKVGSNKPLNLEIYPNPVKGNQLNLSFAPAVAASYTLVLVNSAGQQVMSKGLGVINGNYNGSMALPNNIQPGLYTVVLRTDNSQVTKTILIQ